MNLQSITKFFSVILLCISAVLLIPLHQFNFGWFVATIGILALIFTEKKFSREILLVYISIAILALTPITTNISIVHMVQMGLALMGALYIPYVFSRYVYKDNVITFKFHHGRSWYRTEILYIFVTAMIAYVVTPFFLKNSGSYRNWTVEPGVFNLVKLFIGTNALGIWDELFFISTVLGVLRRFFPFKFANVAQAVMFTAFLYELGFRGWGPFIIFPFALIQGYIFKKTESLFYVITIHLTLDLILYLALIYTHHPTWLPIFFT